jgi:hypothetical protein
MGLDGKRSLQNAVGLGVYGSHGVAIIFSGGCEYGVERHAKSLNGLLFIPLYVLDFRTIPDGCKDQCHATDSAGHSGIGRNDDGGFSARCPAFSVNSTRDQKGSEGARAEAMAGVPSRHFSRDAAGTNRDA